MPTPCTQRLGLLLLLSIISFTIITATPPYFNLYDFHPYHTSSLLLDEAVMTCTGNADNVISSSGVIDPNNALGSSDGSFATIDDERDFLTLDLTDVIKAGEIYTIRWMRSASTSDNPNVTVEESIDGVTWTAAANSPYLVTNTSFSNINITTSNDTRYIRFTTINVYNVDIDAVSYNSVACCTVSPSYTSYSSAAGTCNGTVENNDASATFLGIANADRADISTAGAASYDGDDYNNASMVVGGTVIFNNLAHNTYYWVRLYDGSNGCPVDVQIYTTSPPSTCADTPDDLPWAGGSCNSSNILLQTGIAIVSCGVTVNVPEPERWAFGLMNVEGSIPASGRTDESNNTAMYHHPTWHVDEIGNVYGLAYNRRNGTVYTTASTNYGAGFTGAGAVVRFGGIAGGNATASNDFAAGGAVYQLHPVTGAATVLTLLPQQSTNYTQTACEDGNTVTRVNTGVGLGNIVYDEFRDQLFVSNLEDGKIYRLSIDGTILDTYDPFNADNGLAGISDIEDLAYGLAIEPNGQRLFIGGIDIATGTGAQPGAPQIHSIPLTTNGEFVGTATPTGLGYDNYTGTETLQMTLDVGEVDNSGFLPDNFVYAITDMAFNGAGQMIVGTRVSCEGSIFNSYNHYAETNILTLNTGNNLYDSATQLNISHTGDAADEDNYGGVAAYVDNNGDDVFVVTSADILAESGPHGLAVFSDPPNNGLIDPLAAISYGVDEAGDPKGVGGDVEVFGSCLSCDENLATTDGTICAGNSIDLNTLVTNVNNSTNVTINFFATQQDAENNTNPIPTTVSPITNTTYYARLSDNLYTYCYDIDELTVNITPTICLPVTFSR